MYIFAGLSKIPSYLNNDNNFILNRFRVKFIADLATRYGLIRKLFCYSTIFIEIILGIFLLSTNYMIFNAGIIMGLLLHLSILILMGQGRTFNFLLPASYLIMSYNNPAANELTYTLIISTLVLIGLIIIKNLSI